jgi:hypothetical protein
MAVFKFYKFAEYDSMQYFLNGGITAGRDPRKGYTGIVGKTLVFTQPVGVTVTFVAGASAQVDPTGLSFAEVAAQIKAAIAGVEVLQIGDQLVLIETTPSTGVTITNAGTANVILGFNSGGNVGKVFKYPDGVNPAVVPHWVQAYSLNGYHVLVVRE